MSSDSKMFIICQMVLMLYSVWLATRVFAEFREQAFSNIFKGFSCDVMRTLLRFFHDNGHDIATGCQEKSNFPVNPNSGSLHSLGEINCKVAPGPKTSLALSDSKFTLFPVVFHVCLLTLTK